MSTNSWVHEVLELLFHHKSRPSKEVRKRCLESLIFFARHDRNYRREFGIGLCRKVSIYQERHAVFAHTHTHSISLATPKSASMKTLTNSLWRTFFWQWFHCSHFASLYRLVAIYLTNVWNPTQMWFNLQTWCIYDENIFSTRQNEWNRQIVKRNTNMSWYYLLCNMNVTCMSLRRAWSNDEFSEVQRCTTRAHHQKIVKVILPDKSSDVLNNSRSEPKWAKHVDIPKFESVEMESKTMKSFNLPHPE